MARKVKHTTPRVKELTPREKELLEKIGWQLSKKREAVNNISQREVAKRAKVSLESYRQMEYSKPDKKQRMYRIDTFLRVLEFFNLDIMAALKAIRPKREEEHQPLHDRLDELLQAPHPWPTVAVKNVDAVYLLWQTEKSEKSKKS